MNTPIVESQDKARELTKRHQKIASEHQGNRATADEDSPQPTREPTRDQQK